MNDEGNTPRTDQRTYFLQQGDVVLFLGNSITAGAGPEIECLVEGLRSRYPELANGEDKVRFVLSGLNGNQADNGAQRLGAVLAEFKPTVCVICYGTCEVTFGREPTFLPAMRDILGQLRRAGVAITIVSPPPASARNWRQANWPAEQFVRGLPVMAAAAKQQAAEASVPFANAFAALRAAAEADGEEWTTDGIHLNANGYRVMADALQEAWGFGRPLRRESTGAARKESPPC